MKSERGLVLIGRPASCLECVLAFTARASDNSTKFDFAPLSVAIADLGDLYTGTEQRAVASYSLSAPVPGAIALQLSDVKVSSSTNSTVFWVKSEAAKLGGTVKTALCFRCSVGQNVGFIDGHGNEFILKNVKATTAKETILAD